MIGNKLLVTMAPEIYDYLGQKSERIGISKSSYISMLIGQDREKDEALALIRKIPEERLAELLKSSVST